MGDKKFIEIKVGTGNSKKQVDDLDKSMVRLGKDTDDTVDVMGALSKAAIAVTAALSVRQVIAYADAWSVVNNKLSNSVRTGEELVDVTQRVFDISQATNSSIDVTADLYAKLERNTKNLNLSTSDLSEIVTIINKGFIVSGSSTDDVARAVTQLGQAFDSGALFAEEFNSVNESGNRLIRALSDSLNLNVKQLKDLGSQGKLTTEVLVNAWREQGEAIDKEATAKIETFSQKTLVATNNITKFLGESTLVSSTVAILGDSMVFATENMEVFADIAAILATLYVSRLAPAVVGYTSSIIASVAAQTQATIVTNAYGQVISRTTLTMNAAALATRAFSGALGLLGGPLGVLFIAASSLVYLYTQMETAEEKAKNLRDEVNEMSDSFKNLNDTQRQVEISKLNTQMSELRQQLIKANTALNNWTETAKLDPFANQKVRQYSNEVEGLNEQLDELSKRQQAIFQSGLPDINTAPSESSGSKPPATTDAGSSQLEKESLITESLDSQLAFRISSFKNYTQQILAIEDDTFLKKQLRLEQDLELDRFNAETQLSNTLIALEEKRLAVAESERLSAEDRRLINEEFDAQEASARIEKQQYLTEIDANGVAARKALAQQERSANISIASGAFNDLLGLANGHSRKAFELAKAGAIGTAVIKGYDAAVAAWNAGMSTGGPWAPAVAAAYTASSLLKTGGLISSIKGTQYGSGSQSTSSGGGTPNVSTPGGGATSPSANGGNVQAPTQVFDLRGITADTLLTGQALIDILSQTEGVAVALDGVMQEGRRLGEIS